MKFQTGARFRLAIFQLSELQPNVVSGTGMRDEPLRTSAWEARASAKMADFRSTEMSGVHLAGFSKTLPPNLQSYRDNNLAAS